MSARPFQQEIYNRSKDSNAIIVLPTGTGKTLIAIALAYRNFLKTGRKIVFLVNTVNMVSQQKDQQFLNYLPGVPEDPVPSEEESQLISESNIPKKTGENYHILRSFDPKEFPEHPKELIIKGLSSDKVSSSSSLWRASRIAKKADILVSTPQMVLNLLRHAFLKIDEFSCLIFDECHHTTKNHPYKQILDEFCSDPSQNMRIYGLTASPSSEHKDGDRLVEEIKGLAEAMKGKYVLSEANPDLYKVNFKREYIEFKEGSVISRELKDRLEMEKEVNKNEILEPVKTTLDRIRSLYSVYLGKLLNEENTNESIGAKAKMEQKYKDYNDILIWVGSVILLDLGISSFKEFLVELGLRLDQECSDIFQKELLNPSKRVFLDYLLELGFIFEERVSEIGEGVSDKLAKLVEYLKKTDMTKSRMLLYTERRVTAYFLHLFIMRSFKERPKSTFIMGSSSFSTSREQKNKTINQLVNFDDNLEEKTKMTFDMAVDKSENSFLYFGENSRNVFKPVYEKGMDQMEAISAFREGKVHILVCTSITEEGMDIPACGEVIAFDSIKSRRAYTQLRGRARQENSKFIVLTPEDQREETEKNYEDFDKANESELDLCQLGDELLEETELEKSSSRKKKSSSKSKTQEQESIQTKKGAKLTESWARQVVESYFNQGNLGLNSREVISHAINFKGEAYKFLLYFPTRKIRFWFEGESKKAKKDAERNAYFQVAKHLIESEELDQHLLVASGGADDDGENYLMTDLKEDLESLLKSMEKDGIEFKKDKRGFENISEFLVTHKFDFQKQAQCFFGSLAKMKNQERQLEKPESSLFYVYELERFSPIEAEKKKTDYVVILATSYPLEEVLQQKSSLNFNLRRVPGKFKSKGANFEEQIKKIHIFLYATFYQCEIRLFEALHGDISEKSILKGRQKTNKRGKNDLDFPLDWLRKTQPAVVYVVNSKWKSGFNGDKSNLKTLPDIYQPLLSHFKTIENLFLEKRDVEDPKDSMHVPRTTATDSQPFHDWSIFHSIKTLNKHILKRRVFDGDEITKSSSETMMKLSPSKFYEKLYENIYNEGREDPLNWKEKSTIDKSECIRHPLNLFFYIQYEELLRFFSFFQESLNLGPLKMEIEQCLRDGMGKNNKAEEEKREKSYEVSSLISKIDFQKVLPNENNNLISLLGEPLSDTSQNSPRNEQRAGFLLSKKEDILNFSMLQTCFRTAQNSSEIEENYEIFEFFGDTILKLIATVEVFFDYPNVTERVLTIKRAQIISNFNLAIKFIGKKLFQFVHHEKSAKDALVEAPGVLLTKVSKVSLKIFADIIEALIFVVYSAFDKTSETTQIQAVHWVLEKWGILKNPPPSRLIIQNGRLLGSMMGSDLAQAIRKIEKAIGYEFIHKLIVIEAFSHKTLPIKPTSKLANSNSQSQNDMELYAEVREFKDKKLYLSNEKLEFLGDAALDYYVAFKLIKPRFNDKDGISPHVFTRAKQLVVNNHILAFICLQKDLQSFILCNDAERKRIQMETKNIKSELLRLTKKKEDEKEQLTLLHNFKELFGKKTKVFSDLIEAIIGAVYLDQCLEVDSVMKFLEGFFSESDFEKICSMEAVEREMKKDLDGVLRNFEFIHGPYKHEKNNRWVLEFTGKEDGETRTKTVTGRNKFDAYEHFISELKQDLKLK